MAWSWDSWEVGTFKLEDRLPGSTVTLLVAMLELPAKPLLPLPLFAWLLLGPALLGLGRPTLLTLSLLAERLRLVLPRVSGGMGFKETEFVLLLLELIFGPAVTFEGASADSPTGFWTAQAVAGFPLLVGVVAPSLLVEGPAEVVLAPNAAHPVRPLAPEEEERLALDEDPKTAAEGLTSVLLNARNVLVDSCLGFNSGFLTKGSFTIGVVETTEGAGFCDGF